MTNDEKGTSQKCPAATMSGDPDRELERTLKDNSSDQQAKADVGPTGQWMRPISRHRASPGATIQRPQTTSRKLSPSRLTEGAPSALRRKET
jgi:hypothetical protein